MNVPITEVCRVFNEKGIPMVEPEKTVDAAAFPECPECGLSGTLVWVQEGCFVECISPDCNATFSPSPDALIRATVELFR